MRFSTTVAYLAACLAAPATALAIWGDSASALDASLKVPGENPIEYCSADRDDDLIEIKKVDLAPNPPKPGKALLITASGVVKKTITTGAYVKVTVKYGLIQLLSTTADLCEQLDNVDLACPLENGQMTITKSVDLPSAIPPGTYSVLADVYSADDEKITCLKATVNFPRPSLGSFENTEEL
ncbi:putative phosphatidylglycerol/phosphatidylinositol transfer protein precursor [Trichoderma pleuroticola]|uniref:Phosphatidylglycerol/phosphatidylinositol transfer protein n=2 Tax=Trichoderma TaxID=5543 RepID=A0A9W9JR83_9HYPO|nr:ML domain-containing protein [Trichoderma breve]KAF3072471.1 Phosphatidylglycerol/phosphatidylinositol transfer protein [Trichoderma lentiforme]KAJ4864643.1 ML domain-containing protein [Trichoderma breve]